MFDCTYRLIWTGWLAICLQRKWAKSQECVLVGISYTMISLHLWMKTATDYVQSHYLPHVSSILKVTHYYLMVQLSSYFLRLKIFNWVYTSYHCSVLRRIFRDTFSCINDEEHNLWTIYIFKRHDHSMSCTTTTWNLLNERNKH